MNKIFVVISRRNCTHFYHIIKWIRNQTLGRTSQALRSLILILKVNTMQKKADENNRNESYSPRWKTDASLFFRVLFLLLLPLTHLTKHMIQKKILLFFKYNSSLFFIFHIYPCSFLSNEKYKKKMSSCFFLIKDIEKKNNV